MLSDIKKIHQRVEAMRHARIDRDRAMHDVRLARRGQIDRLHPELFSDDLDKSVVANLVDVAARDTAELMAPLPGLACSSGSMRTDADKARAAKKNKIGAYYWEKSRLPVQNIAFADSMNCYAFGTYVVEPDFEAQCPRIRFESSFGAYYHKDRWGHVVWYAKEKEVTAGDLAAQYPDKASQILIQKNGAERKFSEVLRLVRYYDKDHWVAYLPDCECLILSHVKSPMSRVPVVVQERSDTEDVPRGQYDDAIYPYLARSVMAMMQLNLATQVVEAPWIIPDDIQEMAMGANAVWKTQTPGGVGKANISVPNEIFALQGELDREAKEGARYPEARTGGIKGNIITGRGVEQLMGTMDTQVRTAQTLIGEALEESTSICFEMDEKLWPNVKKTITGLHSNKPFEIEYTPSKDISGSYHCKVSYGFASGQTPSQAIVALLQLRGDNLISRDTVRRNLPFDIDPSEEEREIDVQQLNDSLGQGFQALLQAMGPMVMQGQDPMQVLLGAAKAIEMRQKGTPLAKAILEAMTPPEQPEQPELPPAMPGMGGPEEMLGGDPAGPGGQLPPGMGPDGLMQGVPPGQAGLPPGGMPDVMSLMASLRGGGAPQMEASVMRKRAIGA